MQQVITDLIPLDVFPPAPGQGAICIEGRLGDDRIAQLVEPLNHLDTQAALLCERAFLAALDGSCRTPIGGYAQIDGEDVSFYGLILRPDGTQCHEISATGRLGDVSGIGARAGAEVRERAGVDFFKDWL